MSAPQALCQPFEFGADPTALYRLYDVDGVLLYVGVTFQPTVRMSRHAATQPWWPEVTRKTMTWYSDRFEACDAEEIAIRDEHPRYNVKTSTSSSTRLARQMLAGELAAAYGAGELVQISPERSTQKITPENRGALSIS
jgi:hypothetical protein